MREEFEKLPEIRKIMNENGIHFMNHSGWYEARDFKDFEYEQYINGAWYAWQAKAQAVPEGFILVPKEPTQAMLDSARDWSTKKYGKAVGNDGASGCYKAMIETKEKNQ